MSMGQLRPCCTEECLAPIKSWQLYTPSCLYRRMHGLKSWQLYPIMLVQEKNMMHGVNVTHSQFFDQPKVKEAVAFAAEAHKGQQRKTKEPYVTHCIETACIVEEVLDLAEDSEYSSR